MSDYWFTDEQGRKRHVGGDSNERHSVAAKHNYHAINSLFSSYSSHFGRSRLHSTHCPVCSADVFFCECDNGGRVFFDTLAPTWKKHPCTTNYESGNKVKTYRLIHPIENHFIKNGENISKKTVMEVPDFMDRFELNINNTRVYANLVDNCTILVRQHNGKLLLTILINNKKFKNEYFCRDKEFEGQRELVEFLERVMWNTDFKESLNIKKKENEIKTLGDHKIIQINKQNVSKVLTTLEEQEKKRRLKKQTENNKRKKEEYEGQRQRQKESIAEQEAIRKQRYEEYGLFHNKQGKSPMVQVKLFISKREGLTIVKKKNVPTTVSLPITISPPIVPTMPAKKTSPKMSLDQFGSVSEALKAIKDKLQKQMDENNG